MKRFLNVLKKKWPGYLLEILVLIIGIYGAFALDNWNEELKERQLEKKYLKLLASDMHKNLQALTEIQAVRFNMNALADGLLKMEQVQPIPEKVIQFQKDLLFTTFWEEFVPNTNTLDELTNSGNLAIIENDSIKNSLLNFESIYHKIVVQREHMRNDFEKYFYDELINYKVWVHLDLAPSVKGKLVVPTFHESFSVAELNELAAEANEIITNQVVRNGLKLSILNNSYMQILYDQLMLEILSIKSEIDKTLIEQ